MKNKIVSLFLTAVMLTAMAFPSNAYAEENYVNQQTNATQEADADPVTQAEGKTIYANGKTGVGSDSNPGTEAEPVSSLKKAVELAGENGTVIILDTVYIREPTVLDNNVTIKRGGTCDVGMIYLGQSSLTINHATIDGNKEEYPTTAQLIAIYGAPTLTINEGAKICNQGGYFIQQMITNSGGSGPVVTMNGGEIYNIDATKTNYKSVIYYAQQKGSFYMKGGSIHDNKGGALEIGVPTFEMTGGKIYNNINTGEAFGGIYFRGGKNSGFISGGEIYGNKSRYGAGIHINGQATLTIKDQVSIHDNIATSSGGGVYAEYGKLIMEGGRIYNNQAAMYGGAIYLWNHKDYLDGNEALRSRAAISGGTIEGNNDGTNPSGIDFYEDIDQVTKKPVGPPILELSGSPTIKDPILINDTQDTTSKVDIVGTFTPTQPVPIYDWRWEDNRVIVSYKAGLTPNKDDFVKFNKTRTQEIKLVGQDLVSINITIPSYNIVFKEQDSTTKYKEITVYENDLIDSKSAPQPTKAGYVLSGWKTADKNWDFANDQVKGNMELYPIWKLEPPEFNLVADRDHFHEGDEQDITIVSQITVLGGASLTYQWKWYKDGNLIDGANDNVLNVSETGVYKAEAIVTNGVDSSNPVTKEITITKTDHSSSGDWEHDKKDHWKVCDECNKNIQQAAHTFGEWNVVSRTKRERVCTVCGYKVTEDIPNTKKYHVTYKFVSATNGKDLPKEVTNLLPSDDGEYVVGTSATAKTPAQTTVEVSDGKWTFTGYDADKKVITENTTFTGKWIFEKKAKEHNISYEFISGTKDKDLPNEVTALLPKDTKKYEEGTKVVAKLPAQTAVVVNGGQWVFNGYDADEKIVSKDTVFTGVWNFVKEGMDKNPPVIVAKDVTISLGSSFKALSFASAYDVEEGDLTSKIQVIQDNVDTSKEGNYEVTYQVTNSYGLTTLSTITVTVSKEVEIKPVLPNSNNQPTIKPNGETKQTPMAKDNSNSIKYSKTSVTNKKQGSTKTGDNSPVAMYGILVGVCAIVILILVRKKENKF